MSQDIIRVGIVGAGDNTKARHIPGLQAIDGVQIVSVCNRSRQSGQKVADEFRIPQVYDKWPELLASNETDAIVIGTWPYLHCEITLAALQADKHVLCEARMARNASEAHQMLAASRQKPDLTTQIVPSPMTLAFDETIKQRIAEGFLGQLLAVELRAHDGFIDHDAPMHWRNDTGLSGHNTMSLGIWYEALMRWIGPAVRVSALAKTFVTQRTDADGKVHPIQIPDYLDVIADLACGAQAHLQLSTVAGFAGEPEVFLFGADATLCLKGDKLLAGARQDSALSEITLDPNLQSGWRVEEEFINAIRGKERVKLTTFEDGVKYMEFTEAVIKSAQTGAAVSL